MDATIYLITCKPTGQRYVGCTTKALSKRWKAHKKDAREGALALLYEAMRAHGRGAFEVEELMRVPESYKLEWEYLWIWAMGAHTSQGGFNKTLWGPLRVSDGKGGSWVMEGVEAVGRRWPGLSNGNSRYLLQRDGRFVPSARSRWYGWAIHRISLAA